MSVTWRLLDSLVTAAYLAETSERSVHGQVLELRGSRLRTADPNLRLKINHALQKYESAPNLIAGIQRREEGRIQTDSRIE